MPINSFLYPGAKATPPAYEVANSCRFNYGSSDYLNKTLGTATNRKKFTISTWVKRSELYGANSQTKYLMSAGNNASTNIDEFYFRLDTLDFSGYESSTTEFQLRTNQLFRDVSAWYHIVIAYDSTQGTASNRIKMYVNGTQITSFATETYPDQNHEPLFNSNIAHEIGRNLSSKYFDGYMAEFVFIDGQQLDPTSFGEFDSDSPTIWKPKDVSDLTFGTNGFYLDFEDSSSLGNDAAGSNNFTANNLAATDQSIDTCTNNFAVLNSLDNYYFAGTFSEGNLKVVSVSSVESYLTGTIGVSTGKWYWEIKITSSGSGRDFVGIADKVAETNGFSAYSGNSNMVSYYGYTGQYRFGSSGDTYGDTFGTGDIIGVAMDLDNNKLYFSKNGTFQNSGDPTSGSTGTGALAIPSSPASGFYFPQFANIHNTASTFEANFGSPAFSISSGNTDANGYGNFEYSVPSGYYSLNTKNLAEFG